jgi:hypothetical protein
MKKLYDKRSKLIHGKKVKNPISREDFITLRYYVRESIKSIYKIGLDQGSLLDILNQSGFGQSPLLK